jgi:adenosine deaminase
MNKSRTSPNVGSEEKVAVIPAMSPALTARVDEQQIRALPKAEVHVHLEGTFDLATLLRLARENRVPLPGPAATIYDVSTHEAYVAPEVTTGGTATGVGAAGLTGFLRFLDWQCGLVRTREQAARVAYDFAVRQTAAGVRYSDVIVNPTHWSAWRGRELDLMDALSAGFDDAEQDGLAATGIAYSLLRSQTSADAEAAVEAILDRALPRVVALSVDGDEKTTGRTGERFRGAFARAARGGLRRTVHAGESSGPEGVWDALDLLQAERIDHGIRAIEDPRLVDRLVADGVSLGVCPRSNIALGVSPDWAAHPLPRLVEAGVLVTLNTDDPAPLGTTLDHDWAVVAERFGYGLAELGRFARRSIDASFADDDTKARLRAELDAALDAAPHPHPEPGEAA